MSQLRLTAEALHKAISEPETTFVYQFGCNPGAGFCADYTWFVTQLIKCLQFGIGFRLGRIVRPRGFVTRNGWTDYFTPFFDEVDAPLLDRLNVIQFPLARRIPIMKPIARAWLKSLSRPRADYFMFDSLGELRYLGPPVFGENQSFVSACRDLMRILWTYNGETGPRVRALVDRLALPKDYIAMCVRRGDKIREHAYVEIERYVEKISTSADGIRTVFIATDDHRVIPQVARLLKGYDLVWLTEQESTGYDHARFKSLPSEERRKRTIRFFGELEIMRDARRFFGSGTTNVGAFVNFHRGGERVIWVDEMESSSDT